jgi:N-acetylglucosamine-6-phosphate deacetylase
MDQALRNILQMTGVSLSQAVAMLTWNPARSIHVEERKGLLEPGFDADLLVFDRDLDLQVAICRGEICYTTPDWQQRLGALSSPAKTAPTPSNSRRLRQ